MRYFLALLFAMTFAVPMSAAENKTTERLQKSADVIDAVMKTPEQGIPTDLFKKAVCVAVVPSYKKLALGVGGSAGKGALVCRRGGNGAWGAPWMFEMGGPSIGLQIGGQSTDFVLLVMNPEGARKFVSGHSKLGADASVAGGPVGRTAGASTGVLMQTEILTYSRSRGAFAGLSLEGQVIKDDGGANEDLYGKKMDAKDILFGSTGTPGGAAPLDSTLSKYSPRGGQPFKK
ncbi:MAG TPA: lipid-binding SYLF domain-containing protein [Terriglobia bacterium]|nr:lipid-binding SYLF domain-containing protein [Terriglobia bacterium]